MQRALTDFGANISFEQAAVKMKEHYGLTMAASMVEDRKRKRHVGVKDSQGSMVIGNVIGMSRKWLKRTFFVISFKRFVYVRKRGPANGEVKGPRDVSPGEGERMSSPRPQIAQQNRTRRRART